MANNINSRNNFVTSVGFVVAMLVVVGGVSYFVTPLQSLAAKEATVKSDKKVMVKDDTKMKKLEKAMVTKKGKAMMKDGKAMTKKGKAMMKDGKAMMKKKDDAAMMKKGEVTMKDGEAMMKAGEAMMKDGKAMMKKKDDGAMVKPVEKMMVKEFDAVIAKAPSVSMSDVAQSGTSGTAWLAVYNGKTYHRVIVKNASQLPGTDFYEGWVVKNAFLGQFFSTGRMKYDPATREAVLDFMTEGDKSDYKFVIVTSEPDDGNPKSDKHILEGRFLKNTNFQVTIDVMPVVSPVEPIDKKDDAIVKKPSGAGAMEGKEDGAMMIKYTGTVFAGKSAPLLNFTKVDYDMAVKSDKLVVLYFYAKWCPLCVSETVNALYPAFNELTTDKVVGFRVNYKDNDTDADEENLARQYGVPYQHTKVFVKNGQRILKSPESWDEKRYDIEINKALTSL